MSRMCLVLSCLAALVLTGCGSGIKDKIYKVSGTVKFSDGQPLTTGTIFFEAPKYSAYGQIQPDGSFTLTTVRPGDGAPAGTYTVYFSGDLVGAGIGAPAPVIAAKYATAVTSGLTQEIKPEANKLEITVERYTAPPPPKK